QVRLTEAKEVAKRKAAEKAAEKERRSKIPPEEWLKSMKGDDGKSLYSKFDDDGVPTHDAAGEELSKKAKNVKKEWDTQKKLYTDAQQSS
ncbi:unnamed protein product, partial [Sphacelaria rigidula]